jgi:hypothetical protein
MRIYQQRLPHLGALRAHFSEIVAEVIDPALDELTHSGYDCTALIRINWTVPEVRLLGWWLDSMEEAYEA